jgi:4-hydroxy-2-oxoglutarate aldolase
MSYFKIKGVIPPVITPFKDNGDVDYEGYTNNIKKWNKSSLTGYLVLGSNGEAVYLNEEEKLKLIELTIKNKKAGQIVIAGTGCESTRETIRMTNKAGGLGVDAALIITPYFYGNKMTDEALIEYYTEIADNSNIPVLIYNVTKFTHINISPEAVEKLSKHPNIIGMKDSSGSVQNLSEYMRVMDEEFNLLVGTASAWYPALALGIEGSIMALANICPDECIKVQEYYERGNNEKSKDLYLKLYPVNKAVTATYGIAGLKHACTVLGYRGGSTRKPLLNLKYSEGEALEKVLQKADLNKVD